MKSHIVIIVLVAVIVSLVGCQDNKNGSVQEVSAVQSGSVDSDKVFSQITQNETTQVETSQMEAESTVDDKIPHRYKDSIFEKVDVKSSVVFKKTKSYDGKSVWILLDVYSPSGDEEGDRPVILWIHGGGFQPGNNRLQGYIADLSTEFARRGFVCIAPDYRVRENPGEDIEGTINDAVDDIMDTLNWVRENSDEYNIDTNKIFVGGGSAGGITAVNFCFRDSTDSVTWNKSGILGLVSLWGSPSEDSILSVVDSSDPATLLIHGTADETVPYVNSEWLLSELKENNVKSELFPLEGAGHTPVERMDDVIAKTAEFLYNILVHLALL